MKNSKPIKLILAFLPFIVFSFINNFLSAQNFELLIKDKKETEKDLWKKERLNYYLDSRELNERHPESFFYRGQEKLQKGFYKEAISDFKKAISNEDFPGSAIANSEKGPSNRNAYFNISLCFQQLQQSDSALYFCQKAITEDKYFLDAYIQKAALLSDLNKYKEASEFLNAAEQVFPDSKKIYFTRAQVYLQQDKIAKAKRYLKKASDIDPDFDEANVLLATIYIYDYNIDAAMRILNRSINTGKKPIISLYYRAMIYQAQEKDEKAYHDLNRAYNLDTVDSPVAGTLFIMDYYYKNYSRANKLGKDLWNRTYLKDSIIAYRINYTGYEIGYLLKYVNDTLANPSDVAVFNSFMNNSMHEKDNLAVAGVEEYTDKDTSSMFANRLNIFGNWLDKSTEMPYKGRFYVNDFSKDPLIPTNFSDYSDQIKEINRVMSKDSSIVSMYWVKSLYEYEHGNYEKAIETATQGIMLDSTFLEPFKTRGYCNVRLKNYSSAVSDFNKVIESNDALTSSDFPLAYSYFKMGNYEEALKNNSEVINTNYPDVIDLHNQGLCYEMSNMPDSALKYFRLASENYPGNSDYTRSITRVYKSNGDFDKAIKVLKEAKNRQYSDFMLIIDIADLYVEMGAYENAITYYKKAYHSDRSYTYAYLGAADCYRKLGDSENALRLYDIAIGEMPEHAYTYYAKGLCFFNMGDYEQSIKTTYEAILLNDGFAAAYKLMAENYFILKRYSVSISMGLTALKHDPGNKSIMYQLAASTLAKGNTDEAITFYRRIIDTEKEEKSEAYTKAIEMLQTMVTDNIKSEGARLVLDVVFGKGDLQKLKNKP